jgi:hypothetical protein
VSALGPPASLRKAPSLAEEQVRGKLLGTIAYVPADSFSLKSAAPAGTGTLSSTSLAFGGPSELEVIPLIAD